MDNFDLVLRILAVFGIGLFFWSTASSLEQIARALTKLAERGPEPPPAGRGRSLSGDTKEEPPLT